MKTTKTPPRHSPPKARSLHLETLETRELLSVTPSDYAAICERYDELDLPAYKSANIIELKSLDVDALQAAINKAAKTKQDDVIVLAPSQSAKNSALTSTEDANRLSLDGKTISIDVDSDDFGSLSIVSKGDQRIQIEVNSNELSFKVFNSEVQWGGVDFVNIEAPELTYMLYQSQLEDDCSFWITEDVKYFDANQIDISSQFSVNSELVKNLEALEAYAETISNGEITQNASSSDYAVIFIGGVNAQNNHSRYYTKMVDLYKTLVIDLNLSPTNITILYADGDTTGTSLNQYGLDKKLTTSDMSFATKLNTEVLAATEANFQATIGAIAKKMTSTSHLFVHGDDHGSGKQKDTTDRKDYICCWGNRMSGETFRDAIYQIKEGYVTISLSECFSGGILDKIFDAKTGKVLNYSGNAHFAGGAAANHYEVSYTGNDGVGTFYGFGVSVIRLLAYHNNTTELFSLAVKADPYRANEVYQNNGGVWTEGKEHPWYVGESFAIFSTGGREEYSSVVTTLEDVVDPKDGKTSLREAIAYSSGVNRTVTFDEKLSGTIKLQNGVVPLYAAVSIDGDNRITIDAQKKSRAFFVKNNEQTIVQIRNLTITNGYDKNRGGGIANAGNLELVGVTIRDCEANYGGGIVNWENLKLTDVSFTNCKAETTGGALYNNDQSVIVKTSFSNCSATWGGAIYNRGEDYIGNIYQEISISNSSITGSSAQYGGAIYNDATLTITNTKITDNTASNSGGAVYNNKTATLTATNVTIANNKAAYGAVYNARKAYFYNSLFAYNTNDQTGVARDLYTVASSTTQGSNNISNYTKWNGKNNITFDASKPLFVDAAKGDYRLAANSQAIDKGNDQYATKAGMNETWRDLAGAPRFANASIDIGAYEYAATPLSAPSDVSYSKYDSSKMTVEVHWKDNSNDETGFRVEYSIDNGKTWTLAQTAKKNAQSAKISKLQTNKQYLFRVCAVKNKTLSEYAQAPNALDTKYTLNAPTNLELKSYNARRGTGRLTWKDNSKDEKGFRIEHSNDNGTTWNVLKTVRSNVKSYQFKNLKLTSDDVFRVCAFNDSGDSSYVYLKASELSYVPKNDLSNDINNELESNEIALDNFVTASSVQFASSEVRNSIFADYASETEWNLQIASQESNKSDLFADFFDETFV